MVCFYEKGSMCLSRGEHGCVCELEREKERETELERERVRENVRECV